MLKFKKIIDKKGISADVVSDIIDAHKDDHERMKQLYERYKADIDGPKIFKRKPTKYEDFETGGNVRRLDDKVNNLLNNAFDADIVDTKVGYLLGVPITYDVDDGREVGESSPLKDEVTNFTVRNQTADEDSELGKMAAICGYGARLAYIDKRDIKERIKNIDPWEAVLIGDSLHEPDYALRYYVQGNQTFAEFYDDTTIYEFVQEKGKKFSEKSQSPHLFDFVPLFGVANNKELKGDAEKVLALIDAYDRTLSDASNEIEQYRLAYLILKGLGADEETLDNLKKTGVFELFDKDDDVKYLTKDINDALIEHHLDRLEENILRFSKSVNFSDESFGGNVTGVAMKYKLMALENKSITMERKFSAALQYQFKVLFSAWSKRKGFAQDDYLKVFFGFKRNIPVNIAEEAGTTEKLQGRVSERTRLAQLPFVDDVDYELKEMEEDALRFGEKLEPLDAGE